MFSICFDCAFFCFIINILYIYQEIHLFLGIFQQPHQFFEITKGHHPISPLPEIFPVVRLLRVVGGTEYFAAAFRIDIQICFTSATAADIASSVKFQYKGLALFFLLRLTDNLFDIYNELQFMYVV